MKRLRIIMTIGLAAASVAVGTAVGFLVSLYSHEKDQTMEMVRNCAENADILEIVGRMESGENAAQSFVRLNSFIESVQQKDGRLAKSDTLQTSLSALLRFGLEFHDGKSTTDHDTLDSIFLAELNRHGLYPSYASIIQGGHEKPAQSSLWKTSYDIAPYGDTWEYDVYVSPMPGRVLSRMWGIIIPFCLVIGIFAYLAIYLLSVIRQMRTLESMKDDFTHNMTHELKTPVAVAYSAADSMLRYYDQSNEVRNRKFLGIIIQRLSHLTGMIENILSMSMERLNNMKLNFKTLKLKPIVEEISEMTKLKADKTISIDIEIPDDLTINADSMHFGNMLSNLLDNAVKYSKETVNIRITADSNSITIADDGIGIAKSDLTYIFDKFYRVINGDQYEVGGYGLGLYYVKQIAQLHGWIITVDSKLERGTEFTINYNVDE